MIHYFSGLQRQSMLASKRGNIQKHTHHLGETGLSKGVSSTATNLLKGLGRVLERKESDNVAIRHSTTPNHGSGTFHIADFVTIPIAEIELLSSPPTPSQHFSCSQPGVSFELRPSDFGHTCSTIPLSTTERSRYYLMIVVESKTAPINIAYHIAKKLAS